MIRPPWLLPALTICLLTTAAMLLPAVPVNRPQDEETVVLTHRDRAGGHEARRIVDARAAPYSAVGRIKGTMLCTASVVVHPRIVVTAAHCVRSGVKVDVHLGYQAGTDLDHFKATVWAIGAPQDFDGQSVHEAANDWAILLLERAPIGIHPFLLNQPSADELEQQQILMPSYAVDVAAAQSLSLDPACSARKRVWNVLLHDCQTSLGGSGAPLLIKLRQEYAVVGVHTGAVLERDAAYQRATFVGYEATGTWAFAKAVHALSARLDSGERLAAAGSLAHLPVAARSDVTHRDPFLSPPRAGRDWRRTSQCFPASASSRVANTTRQ